MTDRFDDFWKNNGIKKTCETKYTIWKDIFQKDSKK